MHTGFADGGKTASQVSLEKLVDGIDRAALEFVGVLAASGEDQSAAIECFEHHPFGPGNPSVELRPGHQGRGLCVALGPADQDTIAVDRLTVGLDRQRRAGYFFDVALQFTRGEALPHGRGSRLYDRGVGAALDGDIKRRCPDKAASTTVEKYKSRYERKC